MSNAQSAPVAGVVVLAAASFGIALFVLKSDDKPAPEVAATEQISSADTAAKPEQKTAAATPTGDDFPFMTATVSSSSLENSSSPFNGFSSGSNESSGLPFSWWSLPPNSPWKERSGYGLPNPRGLTDREKRALNLLGGVAQIHEAKYTRTILDDGSRVPGVPALSMDEIQKRLFAKIAAKGFGTGFEEFMREIAIQNPNFVDLKVTNFASWAEVEKILEHTKKVSGPGSAYGLKLTWYNIGEVDKGDWLSFGVNDGKVHQVRAEFPMLYINKGNVAFENAPLIPVEMVPGGRSLPDPTNAVKKFKVRPPSAGPAEVEVFQKLGAARDAKVFAREKWPGNKVANPDEVAKQVVDKPLQPKLIETARKFQNSQVTHLMVTTSKSLSIDQLTDIMNDTRNRTDDTKTLPGQTIRWYKYTWVEFGFIEGQAKLIRIDCSMIPPRL